MAFREHLEEVCRRCDGAVACSLMGMDGIEVDTHLTGSGDVDVKPLLVEYSGLFRTARDAAEAHVAGAVDELSIATDKILTVARLVSPEYYLVLALAPDGNVGRARYLLRVTAPKLRSEL
jgi:predicted regulator of Ras-like GTPase activity (Roadblock/LC7/MglB family)